MLRRNGRSTELETAPGATESKPARYFYGWAIVGALGTGLLVSQGALLYLFSLLVVPIQQELGWNRAALAGAYSLGSFVLGLTGLPVGRLVDRRGPRLVVAVGSVLAALSMFGVAISHSLWQLYLFW